MLHKARRHISEARLKGITIMSFECSDSAPTGRHPARDASDALLHIFALAAEAALFKFDFEENLGDFPKLRFWFCTYVT